MIWGGFVGSSFGCIGYNHYCCTVGCRRAFDIVVKMVVLDDMVRFLESVCLLGMVLLSKTVDLVDRVGFVRTVFVVGCCDIGMVLSPVVGNFDPAVVVEADLGAVR